MEKKSLLLLMVFLFCVLSSWGQTIHVTGQVTDGKDPLMGAIVQVVGSNMKAITDVDGKYAIDVPANSTLQFSYVGFNAVKKKAGKGSSTLNVLMSEDLQQMKKAAN